VNLRRVVRIVPPTFRRLSYDLELFTWLYEDMVELSRRMLSRLRREYGHLTDADGNVINYRLDSVSDQTRRIREERLFKRCFTFSFDAWVLEQVSDVGTPIGPVEYVKVEIKDLATESEWDHVWVPVDPE
jgi:hypothetical protein